MTGCWRRRLVPAMVGLVAMVLPGVATTSIVHADGPTLNGGGSSFAKLELDQWRAETARSPFNLSLNYVAQGSTFGRQQYRDGALDFAASDIPFTADELSSLQSTNRKDFVYVPVSAGGLGFMYNLIDGNGQRVTSLNLSPRSVCRMFTESNMMWNDAEIVASNPGLALPNQLVRPVVRSDGSGTSYVLSEYCKTIVPEVWAAFVQDRSGDTSLDPAFKAGGATSNWPAGWGVTASALAADGVAAAVADSTGLYGITYNEAGFAKIRGFPNASVQNKAGVYTQPTEDAVSIALGYATGRPDGTFQLDYDGPDPGAYFPSTYSYVIAQTTGFSADKGLVLAKFLCYAVTKGQRVDLTSKLGYARLSAPLVDLARTAIAQIPGAPPWDQCRVDSAAPPPAPTTTTPAPTATTAPSTTAPAGAPAGAGGSAAGNGTGGSTGSGASGGSGTASGTGSTSNTTPSAGTVPGAASAPVAPGAAGGGTTAGSTSTGSGGAASTGATIPAGGQTQQTTVSIDPVTGESVVVTVPVSESGCSDPVTGLPADPSVCAASGGSAETPVGGVQPVVNVQSGAAVPLANNPTIKLGDPASPDASKIIWWLLQGAGVCAVGVALAGVRKRIL